MAKVAPKVADSLTPNVEGEAIGLRRVLCIIAPEALKPIPTRMADNTLRARMFRMMTLASSLPWPKMAKNSSTHDRPWLSTNSDNNEKSKRAMTRDPIRIHLFLTIFFLRLSKGSSISRNRGFPIGSYVCSPSTVLQSIEAKIPLLEAKCPEHLFGKCIIPLKQG